MEFRGGKKVGSYFYKILVAPSTQTHKIRIPEKYVKENYADQFANDYVKLRVDGDRVWRVKLLKESGKVWLTKGWEVFMKTYSIKYGYFLLFRYVKGNFEFQVTIFDMSGCEIDYSLAFDNHTKVMEISSDDEEMDGNKFFEDDMVISSTGIEEKGVAIDYKLSVTQGLEDFESQLPHFKLVMHPNNVSSQFRLSIPINHVRIHLEIKKKLELILKRSPDEKTYNLTLNVYNKNNHAQVNFCEWRHFVRDNKLNVGDTCIFELVDPRSITYKVTIFRVVH